MRTSPSLKFRDAKHRALEQGRIRDASEQMRPFALDDLDFRL